MGESTVLDTFASLADQCSGMTIPFIVLAYSMTLNSVAAASRQAWAFARDEGKYPALSSKRHWYVISVIYTGLPFPEWFQKVKLVRGTHLPLNAMIATLMIAVVLSLINLGGGKICRQSLLV